MGRSGRMIGWVSVSLLIGVAASADSSSNRAESSASGRSRFECYEHASGAPSLYPNKGGTTLLCHVPPGHPEAAHTISVGREAVAGHLRHGDSIGECPQACPDGGAPAALPKTGQTGCWDALGVEVDCAGTGADGEYQKGVSVSPRFVDQGDGTVKDELTGLVWLRDANCFSTLYWNDALMAANGLADGACGLSDGSQAGQWRLPNIRELLSLVDYGQNLPAIPRDHPFLGVMPDNYWSSTTSANGAEFGGGDAKWFVYMGYGYAATQGGACFVWPVRDDR